MPTGTARRHPLNSPDWTARASGMRPGESGGRTSASGSGARCARTTAQDGDAWNYFPHDHARSRAYHWGEDGLAGFSDLKQRLCFALALWNGKDPILKERLFGLSNGEGNHGEDVKEYYFYLDSTPTHSYMKWLYKYPQAAFPYDDLVADQCARTRHDYEYELIDTGVFDDDRYFDVVVEYAKASPEECLIRITVANRGPEAATLHLLPTLWFRNTWSWWPERRSRSWRRRTPRRRERRRGVAPGAGRAMAVLRRRGRRCCSPRTRPTPSGSSTRQRDALRQGRLSRVCHPRTECLISACIRSHPSDAVVAQSASEAPQAGVRVTVVVPSPNFPC